MPLTERLLTRVEPDVKQRFEKACAAQGTSPSDELRQFIYRFVGADLPPDDERTGAEPSVAGRRWKVVNTRLTTKEWEAAAPIIEAEAGSVTRWILSLVRERIASGPQLRDAELDALEKATLQLRSVGRNLNQMMRAINEGRADRGHFSEAYAKRLADYIKDTTKGINQLVATASNRDMEP